MRLFDRALPCVHILVLRCRRRMSGSMIVGMVKGKSVVGMVGSRLWDDLRVGLGCNRGR